MSESITKAESWGDITGIAEQICPKENFRFHLFDEAPESTHPDAFDRICERTSVLSLLGQLKGETKDRLIIATTPEALRSACPILEHNLDSEIKVITGRKLIFLNFPYDLLKTLGIHQKFYARNPGNSPYEEELLMFIPSMLPLRIE